MDDINDLASRVDLHEAIETAIRGAFYSWLDEWDMRIEQRIQDGVKGAIREWLDAHSDELRDAIIDTAVLRLKH